MNQAPKNQTEERFAPEHVHEVTFGTPPQHSIPLKLVNETERREMMDGAGKHEGIKRTISMTNAEVYEYLRLGVSTQSASFLKWMGYKTAEELVENPLTAPLLPDHLVREGVDYPMEFIDQCEAEGVSGVVCQTALRRGITNRHLEGPLTLTELLFVFTNLVKKNASYAGAGSDSQPSVANFVCDGTIPLDLVREGNLNSPAVLAVARALFIEDRESELSVKLLSDATAFRNFTRIVGAYNSNHTVEKLRQSVDENGYKVLHLVNPLLCFHKISKGGELVQLGYDAALYTEQFLKESPSSYVLDQLTYGSVSKEVRVTPSNGGWNDTVRLTYEDLDELCAEGVAPDHAYECIVEGRMTIGAVISAHQDGLENALMSGAL